jgi:hypothetical protein
MSSVNQEHIGTLLGNTFMRLVDLCKQQNLLTNPNFL